MNRLLKKKKFPLERVREFLEPTPTLLVTSAYKGKCDIMAMGWYTIMEFSPSLIGCVISNQNDSFELIKKSKACVLNLPSSNLAKKVAGIGNCHGSFVDKFEKFKLTKIPGTKIEVPMIEECHSHFECRLVDSKLVSKYNFFIFEVIAAYVSSTPKYPKTIHYRGASKGKGHFMVSGGSLTLPSKR